ncbi:MAG: ABC transporter ATP-binding protein [Planctomycetes bacterium]|nr:ABC transporter ATP-binding protein [Planctomycetota bacterium]
MAEAIVQVQNVTKVYKSGVPFRAVDRVTFDVNKGAIFGFIGPNGAGKTTLIRMMATMVDPDDGEITIGGFNTIDHPRQVRELLGYMPDHVGMYDGVQVREYLEFFASAYRIVGPAAKRVVDDVMEITDLHEITKKPITGLSKGMRQRVVLAKTLLHDPQVLILDEPAAGLDPRARVELRLLIKELQKMGKTTIVSSHILTELSDICDEVGIIEQGQMVISGNVEGILGERNKEHRISMRVIGNADLATNIVRDIPYVSEAQSEGQRIVFGFAASEDAIPDLIKTLVERGVRIVEFKLESRNLEDLFMSLTRGAVA